VFDIFSVGIGMKYDLFPVRIAERVHRRWHSRRYVNTLEAV